MADPLSESQLGRACSFREDSIISLSLLRSKRTWRKQSSTRSNRSWTSCVGDPSTIFFSNNWVSRKKMRSWSWSSRRTTTLTNQRQHNLRRCSYDSPRSRTRGRRWDRNDDLRDGEWLVKSPFLRSQCLLIKTKWRSFLAKSRRRTVLRNLRTWFRSRRNLLECQQKLRSSCDSDSFRGRKLLRWSERRPNRRSDELKNVDDRSESCRRRGTLLQRLCLRRKKTMLNLCILLRSMKTNLRYSNRSMRSGISSRSRRTDLSMNGGLSSVLWTIQCDEQVEGSCRSRISLI